MPPLEAVLVVLAVLEVAPEVLEQPRSLVALKHVLHEAQHPPNDLFKGIWHNIRKT